MRKLIIKHWYFNWDSVVFGWKPGYLLRVVNSIVLLFCIAGLTSLFTEGLPLIDIILWIFPIVLFFYGKYAVNYTYEELDWEQKFQYLSREIRKGNSVNNAEYRALRDVMEAKYDNGHKFVEPMRFFFPLIVIVVSFIIYAIFGSPEFGFDELRSF